MSELSRDTIVEGLMRTYGCDRENAERAAARSLGQRPLREMGTQMPAEERPLDADEMGKLEKEIELAGDKLMLALGFEVVRFSHPGKTKQTPGIPDRRYYHRERKLALWWEAKAPGGQQRPDQKVFQEMCEAVGEVYVLGGLAVLRTWLAGRRVCVFGVDNTPIPLPREEQVQ